MKIRELHDQIQKLQEQLRRSQLLMPTNNYQQYAMPSPPSSSASNMSHHSVSNDGTSYVTQQTIPTASAPIVNLLSNSNIAMNNMNNMTMNLNALNNMANMNNMNNININTSQTIPIAPYVTQQSTALLSSTPQLPLTQGIQNYNQYGLNQVQTGINSINTTGNTSLNAATLFLMTPMNVSASNVNVMTPNIVANNNPINPNMNNLNTTNVNNMNVNGNIMVNNMTQINQSTAFGNNNNNNNVNFQ